MRISDWSSDVCSSDLSAINAASMLMLAGRKAQARQMAQAALQKLKAADNEVERFYALATESEAALLLDDPTRCRKKLVAADRLDPKRVVTGKSVSGSGGLRCPCVLKKKTD